jgi:hypothetical protein
MKKKPVFSIQTNTGRSTFVTTGTIEELTKGYSYTLECGASWQHEKGNRYQVSC